VPTAIDEFFGLDDEGPTFDPRTDSPRTQAEQFVADVFDAYEDQKRWEADLAAARQRLRANHII